MIFKGLVKYYFYVIKHKYYVGKECFNRGLYWQGLTHDLSKFGLTETIAYSYLFKIFKNPVLLSYGFLKRGIPSHHYRKIVAARLSHIRKNSHHWNHWVYLNDDGQVEGHLMPVRYAIEMICDWNGKSKMGSRTASSWYAIHKNKIVIHQDNRKLIEDLL